MANDSHNFGSGPPLASLSSLRHAVHQVVSLGRSEEPTKGKEGGTDERKNEGTPAEKSRK